MSLSLPFWKFQSLILLSGWPYPAIWCRWPGQQIYQLVNQGLLIHFHNLQILRIFLDGFAPVRSCYCPHTQWWVGGHSQPCGWRVQSPASCHPFPWCLHLNSPWSWSLPSYMGQCHSPSPACLHLPSATDLGLAKYWWHHLLGSVTFMNSSLNLH